MYTFNVLLNMISNKLEEFQVISFFSFIHTLNT